MKLLDEAPKLLDSLESIVVG